jgi:hypothetical protein
MGIIDYDNLITKYWKLFYQNKSFTISDVVNPKIKLSSNYNLEQLNIQSCEDLKQYADFFGGVFQTFDIIPPNIVDLYGSRIKDCNGFNCDMNDKKHLAQYNHSTNSIPWYLNLVNYIEEISVAKKCTATTAPPPPPPPVAPRPHSKSTTSTKTKRVSSNSRLTSRVPKNTRSNSQASKRRGSKNQSSKNRSSRFGSKHRASKIRGGMRLKKG